MKEEIVSPSTGVPYCIEKCMKCNNSETKGLIYRIRFVPVDLIVKHDYRSIPYIIPEGLRRLYEQGMHLFLDKLKEISRLQRIPELSSVLPDFHDILFNEDMCSAEYTFYEGKQLDSLTEVKSLFKSIYSMCRINSIIAYNTGKDIGIPSECLISEPESPGMLHYLFLDSDKHLAHSFREYIATCISKSVFGRTVTIRDKIRGFSEMHSDNVHPICEELTIQLFKAILPMNYSYSDWKKAENISCKICAQLDKNEDYLIGGIDYSEVKEGRSLSKIGDGFKHGCHIQLFTKDMKNEALWYAFRNRKYYIHIADVNAANGLKSTFESLRFASDHNDSTDKFQKLKGICKYPTLLIIEDCDIDNDELFPELLKLPADIIIITDSDYSDYGFACIKGE